jgi:hypothetical protein
VDTTVVEANVAYPFHVLDLVALLRGRPAQIGARLAHTDLDSGVGPGDAGAILDEKAKDALNLPTAARGSRRGARGGRAGRRHRAGRAGSPRSTHSQISSPQPLAWGVEAVRRRQMLNGPGSTCQGDQVRHSSHRSARSRACASLGAQRANRIVLLIRPATPSASRGEPKPARSPPVVAPKSTSCRDFSRLQSMTTPPAVPTNRIVRVIDANCSEGLVATDEEEP